MNNQNPAVQGVMAFKYGSQASSMNASQLKTKQSQKLQQEVDEFLANGGEIKQAVNQVEKPKHGTSDHYKKRSCRCDLCVRWAIRNGLIKSSELKGKKQ